MTVLMQMPGITGESTITEHNGWHELVRFTWGATRPFRGEGVGADKTKRTHGAQLRNVVVERMADSRTPFIWAAMLARTPMTPLKFHWLRTGPGKPVTFLACTLSGAQVVSISETSSGARPVERIELLYQEIEFRVTDVGNTLTGPQDSVTYRIGAHAGG